jgi:hypothetical protein
MPPCTSLIKPKEQSALGKMLRTQANMKQQLLPTHPFVITYESLVTN